MKFFYSDHFRKRLHKRLIKNPKLSRKIAKQLLLLQTDFHHPSLKTHKLKGSRADEYAIWIEGNVRVLFLLKSDEIIFTDIISHTEY